MGFVFEAAVISEVGGTFFPCICPYTISGLAKDYFFPEGMFMVEFEIDE